MIVKLDNLSAKRLGENIKKLREKKGISQQELANLAGLKISNLAKLEGGFNTNPTLKTLALIAEVLTANQLDDLLK